MTEGTNSTSAAQAAFHGALAGLVGGAALLLVDQAGRRTILPKGSDTTSQPARAAKLVATQHDHELSRLQAEAVGGSVALAWCAALGAVFGVVHSRLKTPALLDGLALAGLAYVATTSSRGVLPKKFGMSPPLHQNVEEAAIPISSHLAFGVTTAALFEATA